jgi:DNA repair exonuclease SbcCD ATPase subunit
MKIEIIKGTDTPLTKFFSAPSTPETDACLSAARGESLEDLCRRLESDRDEALNAIHTYRCEVEAWEILNKAMHERDEAREQIKELYRVQENYLEFARRERDAAMALSEERYGYWQDAIQEYEDMRSKWRQVTKERDEAREQNAKLRDIAERAFDLAEALGWRDPLWVSELKEIRAELEKIKEGGK